MLTLSNHDCICYYFSMKLKFRTEVIVWPGEAPWHLTHLPKLRSQELRKKFRSKQRGWNSLPVEVTLGKTVWRTSIFFDKKSESYILPLKAEVRKKEGVYQGDKIAYSIEILV